jgi:hypothetical protein
VAGQIHVLNIALKCFDTPNIGRCHALSSAWHLFVRIGFTTPQDAAVKDCAREELGDESEKGELAQ